MDRHEKNRKLVCVLCLSRTTPLRPISESTKTVVRKFLQGFEAGENLYPSVICTTCRVACGEYSKGGTRVPRIHNYKPENSIITRSQGICKCEICVAASTYDCRTNLPGFESKKPKLGRPRSTPGTEDIGRCQAVVICNTCYSEYGRGKRHRCTQSTRASNLKKILKKEDPSSSSADAAVADYMRSKPETPGTIIYRLYI
jgi:hypothetical protein